MYEKFHTKSTRLWLHRKEVELKFSYKKRGLEIKSECQWKPLYTKLCSWIFVSMVYEDTSTEKSWQWPIRKTTGQSDMIIYNWLAVRWEEDPELKFSYLLLYFPEVRGRPWHALI